MVRSCRFRGCSVRCLSGTIIASPSDALRTAHATTRRKSRKGRTRFSTCRLNCVIRKLMLSRIMISIAMAAAVVTAPMALSARSCILSSAPAQQACKSGCCANKSCCATSKEHKSNPTHPLGKADSNYKVSATCIAVPSAALPSSESAAQLFARYTAASQAHSPPTLALICIRLI